MDGVNEYTCKCVNDYSGKFCEVGPAVYLQTSPCQHNDCQNGICFVPPNSKDYVCKCSPGFSGEGQHTRCSVNFFSHSICFVLFCYSIHFSISFFHLTSLLFFAIPLYFIFVVILYHFIYFIISSFSCFLHFTLSFVFLNTLFSFLNLLQLSVPLSNSSYS